MGPRTWPLLYLKTESNWNLVQKVIFSQYSSRLPRKNGYGIPRCSWLGEQLPSRKRNSEKCLNGIELWLKIVTFWLHWASLVAVACPCPLKKKWKKKKNSTKKWSFKMSLGTSRVLQKAQIRSQKRIPPQSGLRGLFWILRNFFWIPPNRGNSKRPTG